MDITHVRKLIANKNIELQFSLPHALVEAKKDGLTFEDLYRVVMHGEVIEDYGERILLLEFEPAQRIPIHVVLEYIADDPVATVVTTYIPSSNRWDGNWKTRKRTNKKRGLKS
jgi:hypothetical protein